MFEGKCFALDWTFCYMHERDGQMIPLGEISQVQLDKFKRKFLSPNMNRPIQYHYLEQMSSIPLQFYARLP